MAAVQVHGRIPRMTASRKPAWLRGASAWLFVLPVMLGTLLFNVLPMLPTTFLSLTDWDGGFQDLRVVGLDNYARLARNTDFLASVQRTVVFTFATVGLSMAGGLGLALLVRRGSRLDNLFRAIYFLPMITSEVAVALVWRWIFDGQFGPLNQVFSALGWKDAPMWLLDPHWALSAVIVVVGWHYMGYDMLLFLSGLQHISKEVTEAATIDGAGPVSRFFRITLPLLSPTTFFVMIINVMFVFQLFGLIFVMTDGGPGSSTEVYMFHLYRQAFTFFRMGYASAVAWILFAILTLASALQFVMSKRWVFYE